MLRKFTKYTMLPVMALALFVAGCENIGGPDDLTGPQATAPSHDWIELGEDDGPRYRVVRENDPSIGTVTGIIGAGGGKLSLGRHELQVPAGAVSGLTTFSMTKLDDELEVRLTATQLTLNDIGSRGFAVPVKLVLNFAKAKDEIPDPSKLRIFWRKYDGSVEVQSTELDILGKRAIGNLNHFSDYILAVP